MSQQNQMPSEKALLEFLKIMGLKFTITDNFPVKAYQLMVKVKVNVDLHSASS